MSSASDAAVTAAFDRAWRKIQKRSQEKGFSVPDPIWYLTSGRSSSCATGPWNNPDNLVLRINLKHDSQNRPGQDLLGQLIHWAAHAATGASPGAEGRYHSREFADVAEHLGFAKTAYISGLGYPPVLDSNRNEEITPAGLRHFGPEIRALDKAMRVWEAEDSEKKRSTAGQQVPIRGPILMVCSCNPPRWLRTTVSTAIGPRIRCDQCGEPFTIKPGQRLSEADRK